MNRLDRLKLILNPFVNPLAALLYPYLLGLLLVELLGHQVIAPFLLASINAAPYVLIFLIIGPIFGDIDDSILSCKYTSTLKKR